ncbi:MAG: DUF4340 domain-containing protein [Candidatus Hydrogenedentota bacterium]
MRKWKNLVPLVVILAILAALVVLKRVQNKPATIEERLREKVTDLIPEEVSPGAVTRVELYTGGKPEEKLVLQRDAEDPNTWRVSSHFDAPANEEKIEEFIEKLTGLQGEFRAADVTDDELSEFELSESEAFHVLAYTDDTENPAVHVFAGKAPKPGQVFVRTADDHTIYVADVNFRREAQIWSEEGDAVPEPGAWEDKEIVKVAKEEISKVALTMPDKELVLEKREKPSEKKESEDADATEAEEREETEPEYEWALVSGGVEGQEYKETGLNSLLGAFNPLSATEIVDPTKLEEWNLAEPGFKCVLTLKDEEEELVLEAGRPESSAEGYIRVVGAKEPVVYKLSSYNFGKVFPKGSELFDLQSLSLDKEKVTRIEMDLPDAKVVLAKKDGNWTVVEPVADLEVNTTKISTLAGALAGWKASDYTDSASLGKPVRKITFTTEDGQSHALEIGGPSKSIDGNYARLDGGPVVAMTKGDVGKVLVEPKNLYKRALLAATAADVQAVTITPAGGEAIVLKRGENDAWMLGDAEANQDAAEDIAQTIAGLQADEILFGKTPEGFEAQVTIDVTMADGKHKLMLGPETDTGRQLVMDGKTSVFVITKEDADALTPSVESLKKPKPEPTEEATESAEAGAQVSIEQPETEQSAAEPAAETAAPAESKSVVVPAESEMPAEEASEAPKETAPAEGQP